MITTQCSGGCSHCLFASPELKRLNLDSSKVIELAHKTSSGMVIISGGEPFQHPEISKILADFRDSGLMFRVATGGFVDLSAWLEILSLLFREKRLQGISVGTDVISSRVISGKWDEIWKHNIHLLSINNIPFSFTLTIDYAFNFERSAFFEWISQKKYSPTFIYLRYQSECLANKWMKMIKEVLPNVPILPEHLD